MFWKGVEDLSNEGQYPFVLKLHDIDPSRINNNTSNFNNNDDE
jgi:hypothetical protein